MCFYLFVYSLVILSISHNLSLFSGFTPATSTVLQIPSQHQTRECWFDTESPSSGTDIVGSWHLWELSPSSFVKHQFTRVDAHGVLHLNIAGWLEEFFKCSSHVSQTAIFKIWVLWDSHGSEPYSKRHVCTNYNTLLYINYIFISICFKGIIIYILAPLDFLLFWTNVRIFPQSAMLKYYRIYLKLGCLREASPCPCIYVDS